ncbi:MAG: type II toxin-antitoxin system RelE/ParE family toxin, partial [Hyphomicrobiales bacterium]|nr:type II toxin-antitoxin system RelE/ParE family toxin [Hyphomicrobiales bacterium]
MLRTFRSKALAELWAEGTSKRIDVRLQARILVRLDALNASRRAEDMNVPGFDFHRLRRFAPPRYTVHVNGPWCITFEFHDGHAHHVNFEQYH